VRGARPSREFLLLCMDGQRRVSLRCALRNDALSCGEYRKGYVSARMLNRAEEFLGECVCGVAPADN